MKMFNEWNNNFSESRNPFTEIIDFILDNVGSYSLDISTSFRSFKKSLKEIEPEHIGPHKDDEDDEYDPAAENDGFFFDLYNFTKTHNRCGDISTHASDSNIKEARELLTFLSRELHGYLSEIFHESENRFYNGMRIKYLCMTTLKKYFIQTSYATLEVINSTDTINNLLEEKFINKSMFSDIKFLNKMSEKFITLLKNKEIISDETFSKLNVRGKIQQRHFNI